MKKLIAMLLALVMVVGLVACGAKEEPAPAQTLPGAATEDTTPAASEEGVLDGGADIAVTHNVGRLTLQAGGDVGQTGSGNSLGHEGVLSHLALGTGCSQSGAQLRELRHRHASVVKHQHEGRSVYLGHEAINDNALVRIEFLFVAHNSSCGSG